VNQRRTSESDGIHAGYVASLIM